MMPRTHIAGWIMRTQPAGRDEEAKLAAHPRSMLNGSNANVNVIHAIILLPAV